MFSGGIGSGALAGNGLIETLQVTVSDTNSVSDK